MGSIILFSNNSVNFKSDIVNHFRDIVKHTLTVGYIASQHDAKRFYFNKVKSFYHSLGVKSIIYFDLEDEYKKEQEECLFQCDIIHLSTGNTYRFLDNLKRRHLLEKLESYYNTGGIVVGVSAGAHILTPSIKMAQFGDANDVSVNDLKGLGLVKYHIVPHINRKESLIKEINQLIYTQKIKCVLIEDDGGIIHHQDRTYYYKCDHNYSL